ALAPLRVLPPNSSTVRFAARPQPGATARARRHRPRPGLRPRLAALLTLATPRRYYQPDYYRRIAGRSVAGRRWSPTTSRATWATTSRHDRLTAPRDNTGGARRH